METTRGRTKHSCCHLGIAVKSLPARHASYSAVHHEFPEVLSETLKVLTAQRHVRVTLLPFSHDNQRLAESLRKRLTVCATTVALPTKDSLRREISSLDGLVAMPLHASVFGFALGVPTIGLAYDVKVQRLYQHFGLSDMCLPIGAMHAAMATKKLQRLFDGPAADGPDLRQRAAAAGDRFVAVASKLLRMRCSTSREVQRLCVRAS